MISAAYDQLKTLVRLYSKVLPLWTFPWIPFVFAAFFQTMAWFGGRFLVGYTLGPRILILWAIAFFEYCFMSTAMNASVEVLKNRETQLIVIYQVVTLVVFMIVNRFIFKNPFTWRHLLAYVLLAAAVYFAYT
jgi:uncharacterized protein